MLQKVKIVVRNYQKKAGGSFTKITIGGKYVPDVLAEDENYIVRFTSNSLVKEPTKEGIYEVAYEEGKLWIDSRPEMHDKLILRVEAQKVRFYKALPKLDKDIRLTAKAPEEAKKVESESKDNDLPF